MKKRLLLIASFCFLPALTLAQTGSASWSKLSGLQSGQSVQVVNAAGTKYSGTFIKVSDTAVVVRSASGEQSIQRADVRSVKLMQTNQRLKHALIGAGVGGGAGAGIGAGIGRSGDIIGKGAFAAIGLGMGSVVGAVVGAALPAHGTTVYKASAH